MQIELIDCTETPDQKIAAAALTSITGNPPSEIYGHLRRNGMWEEDARKLRGVLDSGHLDILEHAVFTFSLNDISRLASFTLVRHRIPTFTQVSQRYTPADKNHIHSPAPITSNPVAKAAFDSFVEETFEFYEDALAGGFEKEDARYGLSLATTTHLMMTSNLRELFHLVGSNASNVPEEVADICREITRLVGQRAPHCAYLIEKKREIPYDSVPSGASPYRSDGESSVPEMFLEGSRREAQGDATKEGRISIVDCTPDPVLSIAQKHVACLSDEPASTPSHEEATGIIEEIKRGSEFPRPFEHARVTFAYEESLASCHQDIRHRVRTMTVESIGVAMERGEVVTPPSMRGTEFEGRLSSLAASSRKTHRLLRKEGIPSPDALYVALNGTKVRVVSGFDFRNLLKAMSLRCCLRAQWEIRGIYDGVLHEMMRIAPQIFRDAGPGCRRKSGCPEGLLICETPRGPFFSHTTYLKKYPDTRLARQLLDKSQRL